MTQYDELLQKLQALDYGNDPDTNNPIRLLSAMVALVPCECNSEMISTHKWCEFCVCIEKVNSYMLKVFEDSKHSK